MTQDYWGQRREEILAFRDYVQSFDLARDKTAGVWLAESGHQLMETAFQLMFLERESDAVDLAKRANDYYEASLAVESSHPETDPRMASVFQRLYYARWWITGEEPKHLVVYAARAFCAGLAKEPTPENAGIHQRAALLWLEAGEVSSAKPWISLVQESALPGGDSTSIAASLKMVLSSIAGGDPQHSVCSELLEVLGHATMWGQQTASTLWDALQIANVHRRLCGGYGDFPTLLWRIR